MMGTSDIIKLINRDELSHVALFQNMINEIKQENTDYFSEKEIYKMFEVAVDQEIKWSKHIIGKKILGVTEKTIEEYTKWLANERLRSLGLNELYEGYNKNPYKHLEKLADTEGEGNVKANFFEGNVTSYNMSSSIEGWDEL